MREFALTYPQLMNQALSADLPMCELRQLRKGHEFAQRLADGIYRAPGVPLLSHLTRTASILLAEGQNITIILSGMLHAAYVIHYFDDSSRQRPGLSHREYVRSAFGNDVDRLVWEYNRMPWYSVANVRKYLDEFDGLHDSMRHALAIRLANDLEDMMDLAQFYSSSKRLQRHTDDYVNSRVMLAQRLSLTSIAEQIAACGLQQKSFELPDYLIVGRNAGYEMPTRRFWHASFPERFLIKIFRRLKEFVR